ncbi:ammonium transporter [Saccharothrix obliqua]|uniref:ammonium transporter n=1 Tax=Saccharothrix obliqua TaxID=2861747 RepID=UPI001C5EAB9B|nr:ammonium transporter [Saccharothrix obliqua]MBW4716672.1 ammonium transporter [Saccharothrix obliqua]
MDTGDTAWMLTSAALVLLMTPGLAFFYGGMVRSKGVLNMMMMSLGAMGVVGVLWVLVGYSTAFGPDIGGGLLGGPFEFFGLEGLLGPDARTGTVPTTVFAAFQAMFAIIAVALVSGAVADRARFGPWLLFAALWALVAYFPVAHWVFDPTGWIVRGLRAVDFAGGTAVHVNAGAAGLALALVLGRRVGWPRDRPKPHNLPLVVLGAGLLWFGWFGFNAGSAVAANTTAGVTFVNTLVATSAAVLAWLAAERVRDGRATTLGAASGVVAGLVAITPACSAVTPVGAIAIGAVTGALCALAVGLKYRFGFDDALDVVGVHLVGGLSGTVLIGLFADPRAPAGVAGLFHGGGVDQLWRQVVGASAVLAYSFVVSLALGHLVKSLVGFRVDEEAEITGIDEAEHAETAYEFGLRGGTPLKGATGHEAGHGDHQAVHAGRGESGA